MLLSDFAEGSKFSKAGIGKNHIDSPLGSDGLVETIKVGQFGNVSLNASHVAANCFHGLVEFLLATARDEDGGALLDEELCGSQPAPGRAPRNHCSFTLQLLSSSHWCPASVSLVLLILSRKNILHSS